MIPRPPPSSWTNFVDAIILTAIGILYVTYNNMVCFHPNQNNNSAHAQIRLDIIFK